MSFDREKLTTFLLEAKRSTYAARATSVRPLLNGSNQLEYRSGDYFYRDIYFGFASFGGQETVELENHPIWTMVYTGGIVTPYGSPEIIPPIYEFLRQALGLVDANSLYRGPNDFRLNRYIYKNEHEGDLGRFHGVESIFADDEKVYQLRYGGGFIR